MSDLIGRDEAVDALTTCAEAYKKDWYQFDSAEAFGGLCGIGQAISEIEELPPAKQWILCTDKLPEIRYDCLGNWHSDDVILLMNNEEFVTICNGYFSPAGMFEVLEEDGPAYVGAPVTDVIAWMPMPEIDFESLSGGGNDKN